MTDRAIVSLADEFRASADAHKKNEEIVPLAMLIAKYEILQRHKLTEMADKESVADTLFECAVDMVRPFLSKAPPQTYIAGDFADTFSSVISKLLAPESMDHIPQRAPGVLTDLALDLLRKGEAAVPEDFAGRNGMTRDHSKCQEYKAEITRAAATLLSSADDLRGAIEKSHANVATGHTVVASPRLTLKNIPGASS
jgi:hypothetical protein